MLSILKQRVVRAARILSTLMESVGAFGNVLPPLVLLPKGLPQYSSSESVTQDRRWRKLRARQCCYCIPTSTRISHPHGNWGSWYARRAPTSLFPTNPTAAETYMSLHPGPDRTGPSLSGQAGVVGYGTSNKSTHMTRQDTERTARI